MREIRERRGLSVRDVIDGLNKQGLTISRVHIYNIEVGRKQPSAKILVGIAKAMGCDQNELFAEMGDAA